MAAKTGVTGIDPASWELTILPLPKSYSRGHAYGFCNGQPVGVAEKLRSNTPTQGCWWPDGKPELLAVNGQTQSASGNAEGDVIPGHWKDKSGSMRAAGWRFRGGRLVATELHNKSYEQTWATAAGGGAVVGMGRSPGARTVGLLWRDGAEPAVVTAEGDVALYATDGIRVAGSVRGRAMLWPSPEAALIDLTPAKMQMSEVQALDGDTQVGAAFKGFRARAALWRGTAASFIDLTPKAFETSRASGAARGYQVGSVREKDNTRGGSGGSDNRAVIWQGAPDKWFDLNALLPSAKYNASVASAIDIQGDVLRVCGQAIQYEFYHAGTPQEGHAVPVAHPVLWTARLA
jgi:hypothetical protein